MCTSDWEETTCTWNNRPSISGTKIGTTQSLSTEGYRYATLDIAAVQNMWATNYGLCMKGSTTDTAVMYSLNRSGTAQDPYLYLTYTGSDTGGQVIFIT